jgi:hypothetical protein
VAYELGTRFVTELNRDVQREFFTALVGKRTNVQNKKFDNLVKYCSQGQQAVSIHYSASTVFSLEAADNLKSSVTELLSSAELAALKIIMLNR